MVDIADFRDDIIFLVLKTHKINKNNYNKVYESLPSELPTNLKWLISMYMVKNNIETVDGVGKVIAEYYTNKNRLLLVVKKNTLLGE